MLLYDKLKAFFMFCWMSPVVISALNRWTREEGVFCLFTALSTDDNSSPFQWWFPKLYNFRRKHHLNNEKRFIARCTQARQDFSYRSDYTETVSRYFRSSKAIICRKLSSMTANVNIFFSYYDWLRAHRWYFCNFIDGNVTMNVNLE